METEEIREHAARIIREHNAEFEFCLVYEDEELEGATENEWRAIYDAMYSARIIPTWEG